MNRLEFIITEGQIQTNLEKFGKILDPKQIQKAAQSFAMYGYSGYRIGVTDGKEYTQPCKFVITIYNKDKKAVSSIFIYKKDYQEFEDALADAYNDLDVDLPEACMRLKNE